MSTRLVLPAALIAATMALHSDASNGRSPEQATPAKYDLLLRGGHVIDAKNSISAVRDVAIAGGKIAAVAASIDPSEALKIVDVAGLYVTPGLVDIHTHVYAGTGERRSYAGDNSVYPDGFTFRVGVTTVADAGGSGLAQLRRFQGPHHRSLENPRARVPEHRRQRHARRTSTSRTSTDMEAAPTGEMAKKHPGLIVGIKTRALRRARSGRPSNAPSRPGRWRTSR